MALITVQVEVSANAADGGTLVGATVRAILTRVEQDGVLLVDIVVTGVIAENNRCLLHLWPNSRGSNSSKYRIEIIRDGNVVRETMITVPEVPVPQQPLQVIALQSVGPYPAVDEVQLVLLAAQGNNAEAKAWAVAEEEVELGKRSARVYANQAGVDRGLVEMARDDVDRRHAATVFLAGAAADAANRAEVAKLQYNLRNYPGTYDANPATRPDGSPCQIDDNARVLVEVSTDVFAYVRKAFNGLLWEVPNLDAQVLASSVGASLVGLLQDGPGAVARTLLSKMLEVYVSPIDFGAVEGQDNTAAIRLMFASGAKRFDFLDKTWLVSVEEGGYLHQFVNKRGIRVRGSGALLRDLHVYVLGKFTTMLGFSACDDVVVRGLNYQGEPVADKSDPEIGIGYRGATFVELKNACKKVVVDADLKYLRYGVRAGSYVTASEGYNEDIATNLSTFECGYPEAHYLTNNLVSRVDARSSHRAAYYAGVRGLQAKIKTRDMYIAPIQVLLTDALTGPGSSRGCSDYEVEAEDTGSTNYPPNSYLVAISLSRVDPGTTYSDGRIRVNVRGTDTIATTMGAFGLYSAVKWTLPQYPFNWEPSIFIKGLKVEGLVDRSGQTLPSHAGGGDLYIFTLDTGLHHATVSGVDLSGLRFIPGSGAKPRALYCVNPGLTDRVNVDGCNFGDHLLEFTSNPTAPINFNHCAPITRTSVNPSDTSALNFNHTDVRSAGQPTANAGFINSRYLGAGPRVSAKVVNITLSGSGVVAGSFIPANCVVLGLSAKILDAITGASGFTLGVTGALARYIDTTNLAAGSTFNLSFASGETSPRNYPVYTDLVVTAKGPNFAGGQLRVLLMFISLESL